MYRQKKITPYTQYTFITTCIYVFAKYRIPWVQHIVLVVHQNYITYVSQIVQEHGLENKVAVTTGCETRHRSIYAGVKQLKCGNVDSLQLFSVK